MDGATRRVLPDILGAISTDQRRNKVVEDVNGSGGSFWMRWRRTELDGIQDFLVGKEILAKKIYWIFKMDGKRKWWVDIFYLIMFV